MSESNSTQDEFRLTSTPVSQTEERKAKKAAYQKEYHQANREKHLVYLKAWREANRETNLPKKRTYHREHSEAIKAQKKRHYWANKQELLDAHKVWREANRESLLLKKKADYQTRREQVCARKYGITIGEYNELITACNGRCPLCKIPFSELFKEQPCVDHCHATGVVRGILCRACNMGLGHFKDNAKLVRAAARYLERFANSARP
jgi:Recombination endonuclease VII